MRSFSLITLATLYIGFVAAVPVPAPQGPEGDELGDIIADLFNRSDYGVGTIVEDVGDLVAQAGNRRDDGLGDMGQDAGNIVADILDRDYGLGRRQLDGLPDLGKDGKGTTGGIVSPNVNIHDNINNALQNGKVIVEGLNDKLGRRQEIISSLDHSVGIVPGEIDNVLFGRQGLDKHGKGTAGGIVSPDINIDHNLNNAAQNGKVIVEGLEDKLGARGGIVSPNVNIDHNLNNALQNGKVTVEGLQDKLGGH